MGYFSECVICPLNGDDCFVADAWLSPKGIWDATWTEAGKKVRKSFGLNGHPIGFFNRYRMLPK